MHGPVSTGMGDCLWAGKPPRFVTSHSGQLTQPSTLKRYTDSALLYFALQVKANLTLTAASPSNKLSTCDFYSARNARIASAVLALSLIHI